MESTRSKASDIELLLARSSVSSGERRVLTRSIDAGTLTRLRPGVAVTTTAWDSLDRFERHRLRMRALVAVSEVEPVFSHRSAATVHGLSHLGWPPDDVEVVVSSDAAPLRHARAVAARVAGLDPAEVVRLDGFLVTGVARTVVDIASAFPFASGVVTADSALFRGLRREVLDAAVDLAGPRRASRRIGDVVRFSHPGAESAAESMNRVTGFRLGIRPLVLQHPLFDRHGFVCFLDCWDPVLNSGGEIDGRKKYLDPRYAKQGAGQALWDEKVREDRARGLLHRFGRWGWEEACSTVLLAPVLAALGLHPKRSRPTLADYASVAVQARSRVWSRS